MNDRPGARIEAHDLQQRTGDSHAMKRIAGASPQHLARIFGGLYLINIVGGFFAIGYIPAALIVSGNAAATAHNIQTHELLYRLGMAAHLIILVACNIPMTLIFYELFKVVNRRLALLEVFFSLVATAVEGANLLNQFAPLMLLGGGHSLNVFTPEQLQALASLLDLHEMSYNIQQVFYAGDLLVSGYLVFRSTFLPRIVGAGLWIGALCYLTYSFADVLAPGFAAHLVPYIQVPSGLAELSLCLWFLVMGVNVSRWEKQASQASELDSRVSGRVAVE
jgi:hypothetical protein